MSFNAPSTALRSSMASPTDGSRTITITTDPTREDNEDRVEQPESDAPAPVVGVLRLRGTRRTGPRVAWDDDVVDNEHMGKKKTKICCIYHKPRRFDESSSEESSSGSDSDGSCGGEGHGHDHDHSGHHRSHRHYHHHRHRQGPQDGEGKDESDSEPDPNAYERNPKGKGKVRRKAV